MKKRVISLLLVFAIALSLSACSRVRDLILMDWGLLETEGPEQTEPVQQTEPQQNGKKPKPNTVKPAIPVDAMNKEEKLHSGIQIDGSFNEGTLFIGDSLTYGLVKNYLKVHDLLGEARYMAIIGVPLNVFFNGTRLNGEKSTCSPEFKGLSYSKAVEKVGDEVTAVYMMLGTNYDPAADDKMYIEVVDKLLESCPRATIYLQLIPYSSSASVHTKTVNEYIMAAYEHYQEMDCQRVRLIDTRSFVGKGGIGGDGVHMNPNGMEAWYNGILTYAADNFIAE